jgi:peptidoglycan hydrolase-like protein with peptidoglycan-binding domain
MSSEIKEVNMPNPNNLDEAIRNLQTYLRTISFFDPYIPRIAIDGIYSPTVRDAVSEFQRTRSLPVTSVVDKQTWDAIYNEYIAIQNATEREMTPSFFPNHTDSYVAREGEKSSFVAIIQLMLRELGVIFDEIGDLAIDGIFGEATKEAVRAFQRASLLEVTGEVDLETYNRLSRAFISTMSY